MANPEQLLEILAFTAPEMKLQRVRTWLDEYEVDQWNEILVNAPECFDGDEAIHAIGLCYVRSLEELRNALSELIDGDGVGGPVESLIRLRAAYLEHMGIDPADVGVKIFP